MLGGGFRRGARLVAALGLVACVVCTPAKSIMGQVYGDPCYLALAKLTGVKEGLITDHVKKSEQDKIWLEVVEFLVDEDAEHPVTGKQMNMIMNKERPTTYGKKMSEFISAVGSARSELKGNDWDKCRALIHNLCVVFTSERGPGTGTVVSDPRVPDTCKQWPCMGKRKSF